jgi:hypothetical protein
MTTLIAIETQNIIFTSMMGGPGFGSGLAMQSATVVVGPSDTDQMVVTATGIQTPWSSLSPGSSTAVQNVFLQMGQADTSQDYGFADQYALQYITVNEAGLNDLQVTFRIMRLDILYDSSPPPDVGWGQSLRVNILLLTSPFYLQ